MPFAWNTWVISPIAAILIPVFWRKCSTLLFSHGSQADQKTKASLEAVRYLMMTGVGIGNLVGAQFLPLNRTLSLALGLGGAFCILDSHIEFYWYMNEAQRVLLLGVSILSLLGLAWYFV